MSERIMWITMGGLVIGFTVLCFVVAKVDADSWRQFSAQHNCKKVGWMSGDVFNTVGFGSNGQLVVGVASTPGKTGWACDDGVTYWR